MAQAIMMGKGMPVNESKEVSQRLHWVNEMTQQLEDQGIEGGRKKDICDHFIFKWEALSINRNVTISRIP